MLRQFIICLLISTVLVFNIAEAKRFGGGRSFGMQRPSYSRSAAAPAAAASTAAAASKPANRWLGPLAGLAIGGLLASMFMGNGLMGGIGWILGIGIVIAIIAALLRRKGEARQYASDSHNQFRQQYVNTQTPQQGAAFSATSAYPAGFDKEAFLREVKGLFIRMQAASDSKNLEDLREFTTPQVFAEIRLQLQELGNETNKTDVVRIEAELVDIAESLEGYLASVYFSGSIIEEANTPPVVLSETWHFQKQGNSAWKVAGIQQESLTH